MTTWPLRRTQITVVERMRFRFRSGSWEFCAAAELFFKTKPTLRKMHLPQGGIATRCSHEYIAAANPAAEACDTVFVTAAAVFSSWDTRKA
jgi:hypothetical protein